MSVVGLGDARRANRIEWERPVQIIAPILAAAKTINVSAVGMLLLTAADAALNVGDEVALEVPHLDASDPLVVHGRVVRLERSPDFLRVAVDFT
ncbi:PilZ domain-containing protein [Thermanaerothrix sp.]|jgi:2-methylcitrate dehydratase PrpD|uniref:PilZ domain-containing protein n=1 Tax=Thermanaerothrix sp. TaxID=2972675 RepID=UPI002ADD80DB|nr:PilZ domain-containing protein [Thermanaerothrix sp.]